MTRGKQPKIATYEGDLVAHPSGEYLRPASARERQKAQDALEDGESGIIIVDGVACRVTTPDRAAPVADPAKEQAPKGRKSDEVASLRWARCPECETKFKVDPSALPVVK